MSQRQITYRRPDDGDGVGARLTRRFEQIRRDNDVPEAFPDAVVAEAEAAAAAADLPARDETSVPFVTIDPPGAMDLDQALHIERAGDGYRVRYAIADVPAYVGPGGEIDAEARRRGQTIYCPDTRVPLHPPVLSEDAASLLPEAQRPAFVWDLSLDAQGESSAVEVYRAMVRSVRRYDYAEVQRLVDEGSAGGPDEASLPLLKEVGEKRIALEQKRGGASLPMPEQEIHPDGKGGFAISFRPIVPSEDWNAQLSLLTGMAAAELMIRGRIGILRTMPPPDPRDLTRFRRQALGAGVEWPQDLSYGAFLRTLDRTDPKHLALIHEATTLFRGAGYTPFDGEVPEQHEHSAVASAYAHVTAPLRRLVDRFGLALCEALSSGTEVPEWVRAALPELPSLMAESGRREGAVERACTDAVEAAALLSHVGTQLEAQVVDESGDDCVVQLTQFAVVAKAAGHAEAGTTVMVRVDDASIETGAIRLSVVT